MKLSLVGILFLMFLIKTIALNKKCNFKLLRCGFSPKCYIVVQPSQKKFVLRWRGSKLSLGRELSNIFIIFNFTLIKKWDFWVGFLWKKVLQNEFDEHSYSFTLWNLKISSKWQHEGSLLSLPKNFWGIFPPNKEFAAFSCKNRISSRFACFLNL